MKVFISYFLIFSFFSSAGIAQPAYQFRQLSVGQGLPGENVRSLHQDQYGFLWFGIESEGLCKYNGSYFENLSQHEQDSLIINTNYINGITSDRNGNLWLATEKGLTIFDRQERKYLKYNSPVLNHSVCLTASSDSSGVIWLGTSLGLMKFVPKAAPEAEDRTIIGNSTNSVIYVPEEDALTKRLKGIVVKKIFQESENSYWIGTESGLFHYDKSTNKVRNWHKNQDSDAISNNEISDIVPLSPEYLLIGTDNGVNLFERKTNKFARLAFKNSNIFNDAKVGVVDIHKDYQGTIWIGTSSYGIVKGEAYLENGRPLPVCIKTPQLVQGISSKHIKGIFEDHTGQLWISTKFGGTFIFDKRSQTFPLYSLGGSNEDNIENQNFIISAEEDPEGNIWIGTRDRSVLKYSPEKRSFTEFPVYKGPIYKEQFLIRRIECLYYSSNNHLWLGHKGGLTRLNPSTNEQIHLKLPKVQTIYEDPSGNLWLGTIGGIFIYDPSSDTLKAHTSAHRSLFSSREVSVENIYQDRAGTLWIGSNNNGLYHYFPEKDSLVHFTYSPGNSSSLSGNTIRSIMEDSKGRIWIGTKSSGLNLYNGKSGFTHFKKNDGLPSNSVFTIIEDEAENLWLITNNGVSRFNYEQKKFTNFSRSHGLQGNVFERRASIKCQNGKLFIAGNNGFNLFHPSSIRLENTPPPLVVTSIKANSEVLEKDLITNKHITLPYNKNLLAIEFSSLDFRDPASIKYAYKLEGVDSKWVYSGNSNSVTFSNLQHGDYTFRFKATDANGNWSEAKQAIMFTIQRPPWLSWWAYLFYTIFAGLLVFSLYYMATIRANYFHQIKSKEVELQRAQELHQMKLNFFTNISHELRTPLTLIIAPLDKLIRSTTKTDKIYSSIRAAYNSSRQLLHLADQLIYFRKAEQVNLKLKLKENDIVSFLQELSLPFQELAEKEKIHFEFRSFCPELNIFFDADKVEKIINNLLINAFKFTPRKGKVELCLLGVESMEQSGIRIKDSTEKTSLPRSFYKIQVTDTGKGMTEMELNNIFNRYYQSDPLNVGAGIGLELAKSLLELHKGAIKVESQPGVGSCFTIFLPAEEEVYSLEEFASPEEQFLSNPPLPVASLLSETAPDINIRKAKMTTTEKDLAYTLLIVEDNVALVRFLQENLGNDFVITVARNGKEAISKLEDFSPDIILSDIMMEEMNGLEFCKAIKENINTSHIPVILLTAKTMEEHQVAGYEHGAEGYLLKPFDIEVLKAKLKSHLTNRQNLLKKIQREFVFEPRQIATNNTDELFLKKLLEIVKENFQNPDFHVEELASDLHLSRSQLFRKLKSLTGQTPSEYLYAYRISRAINLLKEGQLTIAEIAYKTGFRSPNSFTKTFTKHMGASPKNYKGEVFI